MNDERRRGDTDRMLGEHSAKLQTLTDDIAEIKADVKSLVANENKREGAKKAVYGIAAIAGTLSSLAVSAAVKFWPK